MSLWAWRGRRDGCGVGRAAMKTDAGQRLQRGRMEEWTLTAFHASSQPTQAQLAQVAPQEAPFPPLCNEVQTPTQRTEGQRKEASTGSV